MPDHSITFLDWLTHLFNPPPLESMSRAQKVGRALFVTLTLVIGCILVAMLGAVGIFILERWRDMMSTLGELRRGLEIIFAGVIVNTICLVVLFQIRKADRKLIPPRP